MPHRSPQSLSDIAHFCTPNPSRPRSSVSPAAPRLIVHRMLDYAIGVRTERGTRKSHLTDLAMLNQSPAGRVSSPYSRRGMAGKRQISDVGRASKHALGFRQSASHRCALAIALGHALMACRRNLLLRLFGRPKGLLGRFGGLIMARMNRDAAERVIGLLEVRPNDRVLEIGFGPGRHPTAG